MPSIGACRACLGATLFLLGACSGFDHGDLFGAGSAGHQRDARAGGVGGALGGEVVDGTAAGGTSSATADASFGAGGVNAGSGTTSGGSAGTDDSAGASGAPPPGTGGAGPTTAPTDGALGGAPGEDGAMGGAAGMPSTAGSPDAGRRDAGSRACVSNDDCASTEYCRKTGCAAAEAGRCTARPVSCTNAENPVCGCNGVTYFNPCLAAIHQQNVVAAGECTSSTALECEHASDPTCNAVSGFCGLLLEDERPCLAATLGAVRGHCWVLPAVCSENGVHYDSCIRGGSRCVHTCQAIRDEAPYFLDTSCN